MKNLSQDESNKVTLLFLIFAILFGIFVRIYPLLRAGFPLLDGGMFYTMVRDLQAAHFSLPMFTSYNQAQIPFAYPPFGLYFAGLLNTWTGLSLLEIIHWLPVIVNLLIIPLFYLFVSRLVGRKPEAALATLLFALTPNSYWLQIDGGGLTRSWGALFFLFTAYFASQMYREKKPIWIFLTCIAGSLTVLSHLVWALQAAVIIFLFWVFWGRNRQGILRSIVVFAGIGLLTCPWWGTIIHRDGIGLFYLASQATHAPSVFWAPLISFSFTAEITPVIAILAILGGFIHLAHRDYLPVLWLVLILIVDSRGGIPTTVLPAVILAATTLSTGIAPLLMRTRPAGGAPASWTDSLKTTLGRIFWAFLILLLVYNAYDFSTVLSDRHLSQDELDAFQWVDSQTPLAAKFLVLDWESNWAYSSFTEWFPALTGRRSITTVQGTEWLSGGEGFLQQIKRFDESHACLYRDAGCLEGLAQDPMAQFDYMYLSTRMPGGAVQQSSLLVSLENSNRYQLVYSSPTEKIFKVIK